MNDIQEPFEAFARSANEQLSYLVALALQANPLDFAMSTTPEFRGMQDAGWNTAATAAQVHEELTFLLTIERQLHLPEVRHAMSLYAQLSEAGGFYETISNVLGILEQQAYTGWPFQAMVKVKTEPKRIIGPNSNAMFRALATKAERIGMPELAGLFEDAFRDDLRNAVAHADYIIADDGVRLRKRNGGVPYVVSWAELDLAMNKGLAFFDLVRQHWHGALLQFHPARELVGRFSANIPMKYMVHFDPATRMYSFSTSSAGAETSPEYERQEAINAATNCSALAIFIPAESEESKRLCAEFRTLGFSPKVIPTQDVETLSAIRYDAVERGLWHTKQGSDAGGTLAVSPFGFFEIAEGEKVPDWSIPTVEPLTFNGRT